MTATEFFHDKKKVTALEMLGFVKAKFGHFYKSKFLPVSQKSTIQATVYHYLPETNRNKISVSNKFSSW